MIIQTNKNQPAAPACNTTAPTPEPQQKEDEESDEEDWLNDDFEIPPIALLPTNEAKEGVAATEASTASSDDDCWLSAKSVTVQSVAVSMHDDYARQKKPRCAECTRPLITEKEQQDRRCVRCMA